MRLRDRSHCVENFPGAFFGHDRKVELGAARSFRLLILAAEFTGEQTTGEWTPDQKTHLFSFQERNKFAFEVATGDGVVGLQRIEARKVLELRDAQRPGDL